jgi:hypothetical protein
MGGGGERTTVEAPKESAEQRAYWSELAKDAAYARDKKIAEETAEATRKSNLRTSGLGSLSTYYDLYKQQLEAGALTADEAQSALEKYQNQYGLEVSDIADYIADIEKYQTEQLPTQRKTLIKQLYKDLLGREASDTELENSLDKIASSGGEYDLDAIGTSLKSSDEYKERVGGSYLENYYRTYYGKSEKETVKGTDGAPDWEKSTGRYTVNLGSAFSPELSTDLQETVGLKFGALPESFTGTVAEIEQMQQKLRQRDEFAYNSGLTKLQGQIDSDIQKIKNKGTKDVAEIQSKTNIYGGLTSGFW